LDIIHTISGGVQYFVDLSTSITTSFETVKQWFANIIIIAEPSVTLTQLSQSDFTITITNPVTTGWTLNIDYYHLFSGSWLPTPITLFTQVRNVLADAWQFTWTQEVPVSTNVTIVNKSLYTSGTLHYQITNLDTNMPVTGWIASEEALINPNDTTIINLNMNVPIRRSFEPEHFRINVKLSLSSTEIIEGQADFTVEKDMVKQFYSNVALLSLCGVLVSIAYVSYKTEKKPWEKYPILENQKKRKYPKREGKS
jgi:hypothetical protein